MCVVYSGLVLKGDMSKWLCGRLAQWPKLSLIFYKYNKNIISLIIFLWAANLQVNLLDSVNCIWCEIYKRKNYLFTLLGIEIYCIFFLGGGGTCFKCGTHLIKSQIRFEVDKNILVFNSPERLPTWGPPIWWDHIQIVDHLQIWPKDQCKIQNSTVNKHII